MIFRFPVRVMFFACQVLGLLGSDLGRNLLMPSVASGIPVSMLYAES